MEAVLAAADQAASRRPLEKDGIPSVDQDEKLRETAKQFEIMFVAQMLKAAKVGEAKGPFTGGYGEEAFRSFLVQEYAAAIVEQDSLGLAEQLYQGLKGKVAPNG